MGKNNAQDLFQKGHKCNFSKKTKEMLKKDKIFENFGKKVQNLKIF